MSYTLKNLQDVEDSAPRFGMDQHQEARFAREDLGLHRSGLAFHRVKPGQRQGFAHRHETAEEVYVILSGTGRVKLDDELVELRPLDAIRVEPQVARSFEAAEDGPLEILALGPHEPDDKGELITDPAFWDDV